MNGLIEDNNTKEYILNRKNNGMPLSKSLFKRKFQSILNEINDHNNKYLLKNDKFSQEVYNWIFDIKENPKCPLTGLDLKFDYHKFKYRPVRGKGKHLPDVQQIITSKRLKNFSYKKLYESKRNVEPVEISFEKIRKLLNKNFKNITNFGGFTTKFLSRFPEYYNYVDSDQFLPWCESFQEKIYCIINNIPESIGKKYMGFGKGYSKYADWVEYRRSKAAKKMNAAVDYDKDKTILELNKRIEELKLANKATNNLRQSFMGTDPNLVRSIFTHTSEYPDIKFSNRVFLLLNGQPVPDKGYIKPVFFSLDKGYSMRFSSQNGTSKPEQELFDWLGGYIPNLKKDRTVLNGREIDVFSEENGVGIEYDGVYWHNYEIVGDKSLFLKNQLAKSKNIRLLHIFETEWLQKQDIVKSIILSKFNIFENKYHARKCDIRTVDSKICVDFLNENHLQGKDNSKYKYGLYHKDELVSVMTFGQRTITKNPQMELIRFCNKKNTTVIGGAGKLFKHFIKTHNPTYVKTYANARISDGDMYKKLGFSFKHHSPPNYWYYKPEAAKKIKLMHRSGFQKHRLSGILERFDKGKTEWENMSDHGYKKIYDCGNLVFEYQREN
jgi:hypothetical protein